MHLPIFGISAVSYLRVDHQAVSESFDGSVCSEYAIQEPTETTTCHFIGFASLLVAKPVANLHKEPIFVSSIHDRISYTEICESYWYNLRFFCNA